MPFIVDIYKKIIFNVFLLIHFWKVQKIFIEFIVIKKKKTKNNINKGLFNQI